MSLQGLEAYTLPPGNISENSMSKIESAMKEALTFISQANTSSDRRADTETIRSCLHIFQEWLGAQACVNEVSTTYAIDETEKYEDTIFMTFPGQIPFDIKFKMDGPVQKQHRLMLFITPYELFTFGCLVENKSLGGVDIPPNWPKDPWAYWDERP